MTKRFSMTLAAGSLAAICLTVPALIHAQAPAGSTGQCKDGTYSTAASKDGACRGHKGVQTWYAASTAAKAGSSPVAKTAPAPKSSAPAAAATSVMPSGPAPSGSTGQCNDGSFSSAASKSGACRGHQGVKTWFAASSVAAKPAPPAAAAPAAAPMKTAPAATYAPTPAAAQPRPAPQSAPARTQPAAGGGNGQVWVNTESKVYHCSGDRYYGKTKKGVYMSQSDAQSKGYRPDAGKACPN
jgi:hypothetical protein